MMKDKAELSYISEICDRYKVEFSVKSEGQTMLYKFGDVIWAVPIGKDFTIIDLFYVAQLLAAKYPERILEQ